MSLYDITVTNSLGENIKLSTFQNQVLLIVNTASGCGLAPQFSGLQQLYNKYHEKGFSVLGFPCNQFGNQEPLSAEQAQASCQLNFGVDFPMFNKVDVNGDNAHPLFTFLKQNARGFLNDDIKWNFTKFLVDKQGNIIHRFAPTTDPKDIEKHIEKLL